MPTMVKKNRAFTLIEVMITVAIIGIIAAIGFPRLVRREPRTEWRHVTDEINNLVYFARQESISSKKIYRLAFNAPPKAAHTVVVERMEDNPEKPGEKHYVPTKSDYFEGMYTFPETIKIHAAYKGRVEQLEANKNKAHCYVIPDGLVEDFLVHLIRIQEGKESKISLKVLPFFGTFERHDGYLKPGG